MNPRMPVTKVPTFGVKERDVAELAERLMGNLPRSNDHRPPTPQPPTPPNEVALPEVTSLKDLIDPKTGEYYTGVVSVTGVVDLFAKNLSKLPVKFGKVGGNFYCHNNKLTSLEGVPNTTGGNFSCYHNKLTSLEGIHKLIKKIKGELWCERNPVKSGGIGLLLIEGLTKISADQPAFEIINKYIGQGKKGVLLCQDELIEAGYEEYARL